MDKYYSKKALVLKVAYCFCLPLLHQLLTAGESTSLLWLFFSFVLIGSLYTVPMWFSLNYLRRYRVCGIGRYVLYDLVTCFAPAVLSSVIYEISVQLFVQSSSQNGLYTLLIFFILLSVSGVFWLLYLLAGRHSRP